MLETGLRHAATVLLESAIRIAPADARDWGSAMRSELNHVPGQWAALMWSLGGSSVLMKHALASLFIPGRRGESVPAGAGIFAKNDSLRKAALAAGVAYVLAALIFFATPPFRQGLRVSLAAWNELFHVTASHAQPELRALAKRAEARHDPEGMVFVAARLRDGGESARLADEAVRLDPSLTWAYAVVAVRQPELAGQWLPKLVRWDPQNAHLHLIAAESIDIHRADAASKLPPAQRHTEPNADGAWQSAMAAAFASPKFDDYLDRLKQVDRRVAIRYGLSDPFEMLSGEQEDLPSYAAGDCARFAKSLLQSGQNLEAAGRPKEAAQKYWAVARFGQEIDSEATGRDEHWLGPGLQAMAYGQLQALSETLGEPAEASLFGYLAGKFDIARGQSAAIHEQWVFGQDISRRNAASLQLSSLMMIVFSALIAAAVLIFAAGSRGSGRSGARRLRPAATVVAVSSAAGLLLSAAMIYLTYRPYWYIFQRTLNGDTSQVRDLFNFLLFTRALPFVAPRTGGGLILNFPVYFWAGVSLLGAAVLILILLGHFRGRLRTGDLDQSPYVP